MKEHFSYFIDSHFAIGRTLLLLYIGMIYCTAERNLRREVFHAYFNNEKKEGDDFKELPLC